jgi:hypothetical protein
MGLKQGVIGNMMGTHWELEREHVGNKGKMKKLPFYPNLKRKKNQGILNAC